MPSSAIRKINYDPALKLLKITFVSGAVYAYSGVPGHVYAAMEAAFSKGSYFNERILGRYEFRQLRKPE